jgi:hypothetical protein
LDTPAVKERVVTDKEGIGSCARKRPESRVDLREGAGFEELDLQLHGMS